MAKAITELTAASALTGAELAWVEQGGLARKATTQAIADLGGGGVPNGTVEGEMLYWDQVTDQEWKIATSFLWDQPNLKLFLGANMTIEDDGGTPGATGVTRIKDGVGDTWLEFNDSSSGTMLFGTVNDPAKTYFRFQSRGTTLGSSRIEYISSGTGSMELWVNHANEYRVDGTSMAAANFEMPVTLRASGSGPIATVDGASLYGTFQGHPLCRNTQNIDHAVLTTNAVVYRFNSPTTIADPGAMFFRTDNATPASVTEMAFDDIDAGNAAGDTGWWFKTLTIGDLIVVHQLSHIDRWAQYTVDAITDQTGWWQVDVTYVAGLGSAFVNSEECQITAYPHSAIAAAPLTPWTSDIDAASFNLTDVDEVQGSANYVVLGAEDSASAHPYMGYNIDMASGVATHLITGAISGVLYQNNGDIRWYGATSQTAGTTASAKMVLSGDDLTVAGFMYPGGQTIGYMTAVTGEYGSVQVDGADGSSGTWEGYNIAARAIFMCHPTEERFGLYDDVNTGWALQWNVADAASNEQLSLYSGTAVTARTQVNSLTGNTSGLEIKDYGGTFRDAGFATMEEVTFTSNTVVTADHWSQKALVHTDATTHTLTFNTLSTVPDGAVMWVKARTGIVTLVDGTMVLTQYAGAALTTGDISVAIGGWATIHKTGDSAADVTGVGLT